MPQSPSSSFPLLWWTSHTPQVVGQQRCAMARYLGYHAGRHGTGYRRTSQSVPLATGSAVHKGLELLGGWLLEYQHAHGGARPTEPEWRPVVAWAASEAAARYVIKAEARGFVGEDAVANEARATLIAEQRTLIEALVWVWALIRLPYLLPLYRVLNVEQEETFVLACTCGLGESITDWTTHAARDCQGIVQQGRADWLLESVESGGIAYVEFKTKASGQAFWEHAWEHAGQLQINMKAASMRLGKPVSEAFIDILFKGWRGRDKGAPPEERKYQHSPLCSGYYQPAAPPFRLAEWQARYKWVGEDGKGHTLPKTYERRGIWEDPDLTVEDWVTDYLNDLDRANLIKVLGPYPPQSRRLDQAMSAIVAEELHWQEVVEGLRVREIYGPADRPAGDWPATQPPEVDLQIARSWACTNFDDSPCDFVPICNREPGWESPLGMGIYEIRTPHHTTERAAVEACGVSFPADEDDEEADSDD
jgi:hypothetical protein